MEADYYSVGDWVEVLWQGKQQAAKVLHVHDSGAVDVAYDVDNSIGMLLSAAEHGLNKIWMPPDKKGRVKGGRGGGKQRV